MNLSPIWVGAVAVAVVAAVVIIALVARRRRKPGPSATSLYIGALDALLSGDESLAEDLLRQTVRADSGNAHAYIKLGALFRRKGETGRAVRVHREIAVRPGLDRPTRELALSELARDYRAQRNRDKALVTLEDLRQENRKNLFAHEAAAELMEEQGEWDRAYELRKQIQRLGGSTDEAALANFQAHVGRERARQGNRKSARDHFREAFRRDKQNLAAHLYYGDLQYQQGKLEDAIETWRKIIQFHPERAHWVFKRLEKALFDLGQFETMMDIYEDVLKRKPDDVRALLAVAQLHQKKGDLEGAEKTVLRVLGHNPEERLAQIYLALISAEQGEGERAAEVLAGLLEREITETERFRCSACGSEADEILSRCARCGRWDTLEEARVSGLSSPA